MKITQIRNATIMIEFGHVCLLVDPMLANAGTLPPLKLLDGQRRRNPIVELPDGTDAILNKVTHCLITHCQKGHFDHLDNAGKRWLRETQIPVICTQHDAAYLRHRNLNVDVLEISALELSAIELSALELSAFEHNTTKESRFFNGTIRTIPCRHGKGVVGLMMEHGVGYYIQLPNEPSLYLSGDTILTDEIRHFITTVQPDVCVIPAGGAHFDIGGEIIMGIEDTIELTRLSKGIVIANHLEALSHCPVKRCDLNAALLEVGIRSRLKIPEDGETCDYFL